MKKDAVKKKKDTKKVAEIKRKKRVAGRARWKDVERTAAAKFTELLSGVGMSPMVRIPILGREGPDLTLNESRLVVNVKSRKVIPGRLFAPGLLTMRYEGDLIGFRLSRLLTFTGNEIYVRQAPWKPLQEWYELMEKWTKEFEPDGISCIVLHRPGMPVGNSTVVIHQKNLRRLICNLETQQQISLRFDQATFRLATAPA